METHLALVMALALIAQPAAADWPICDHGRPKAACVIDGDGLWFRGTKIRLARTDAPETARPRCRAELEAGRIATLRLARLMASGPVSVTHTGRLDRYGRTLATVTVDGADVEELLLSEGLTLRYRTGAEAKAERIAHWCGEDGR